MFHKIQGLTAREAQAANTRVFTGDGSPYLRVPGLLAVEAVRVGNQDIPLFEEREYPKDAQQKRFETKQEPLIALDHADDGTPILLRSILSNDGMWQKGQPVYVTGEWADQPTPAQPQKPATEVEDEFSKMEYPQLKEAAAAAGLEVRGNPSKVELLAFLREKKAAAP